MIVTRMGMPEREQAQVRRGSRPLGVRAGLFTRVGDGPLLRPTERWWENSAVFNPGAAEGPDGVIHLLYRAQGKDLVSRLGHATTRDGVTIEERWPESVFDPDLQDEFERLGTEDPRIVRLDHTYYVTYTAVSLYRSSDPHPE
ncbi:MAG: hypothetical protein Q8R32_02405, partial [bacterium]|nr:hypothetical protein [bacterium]